jgi:hypothetical protein
MAPIEITVLRFYVQVIIPLKRLGPIIHFPHIRSARENTFAGNFFEKVAIDIGSSEEWKFP